MSQEILVQLLSNFGEAFDGVVSILLLAVALIAAFVALWAGAVLALDALGMRQAKDSFTPDKFFSGWLDGVAERRANDRMRDRKRRPWAYNDDGTRRSFKRDGLDGGWL